MSGESWRVKLPYRQTQVFPWMYIGILGCLGVGAALLLAEAKTGWPPAGLLLILAIFMSAMSVWEWEINEKEIALRFTHFHWYVARWRIEDIESAEAVQFSPMRDFHGWGFRMGTSERFRGVQTCNMRGNRGLLIKMRPAAKRRGYLLGMGDPEHAASILSKLLLPA